VERTGEARSAAVETTDPEPRAVRWYSVGVCTLALAIGVVLVVAGSPLPTLGPILLLAFAAALCVNSFALFPSEHAATAEGAVLLAAVVGFATDAPYLGPLAVALLVGPLDVLHWEQRSWVRMAYNAGNRGLATLAAAGTFAGARALVDGSTVGWVVAVLVGTGAFFVVDEAISIVLLRLHGEGYRSALSQVIEIDALAMPIALVGAATGILAHEVGWWAMVLALLPAAFVPELVVARARVRAAAIRDLAALLSVIAILATVALVTPVPDTATLAILCALAVVLGIEVAPRRGALVPPLVALVVIPACVVLDGDRIRVAVLAVALVTTATSWWCERRATRGRVLAALAVAAGAGLGVAQLALELPRTADGLAFGALTAGVAFEVVTLLVAPQRRRQTFARAWTVPLLAVSVAAAAVWRVVGHVGGLVLAALVVTALIGWAGWGAPAWGSRLAARAATPMRPQLLRIALVVVAGLALAAAVLGVSASEHAAAVAWSWTSAGLGEVAIAMTAAGVRQWRFAPWPRRRGFVATLAAAVVLVGAAAPLGARGSVWGPVVVGVAMVAVVLTARVPGSQLRGTARPSNDEARTR
jgi:hypothetical protein